MNPLEILAIIETATQLAKIAVDGTRAKGDVETIAQLEDLLGKVIAQHEAESGLPMDLSKFSKREHI